jgi:hypothetical protein
MPVVEWFLIEVGEMKIQRNLKAMFVWGVAFLVCGLVAHAEPAKGPTTDQWMAPILGVHALHGDPGCEKVELKIWPQGSWNAYQVLISGQTYSLYYTGSDSADLEVGKLDLRYSQISRNSWGKAISRIVIEFAKNEAGALSEVTVKDQIPGILWFWKNYAAYSCRL